MSLLPRTVVTSALMTAVMSGFAGFAWASPVADASAIRAAVPLPLETVQGYSYNNGPWDTGPAYGSPPYYGYGPYSGYAPAYPAPYAYTVPAPRYYVAPGPFWYGTAPGWRYRRAWGPRW